MKYKILSLKKFLGLAFVLPLAVLLLAACGSGETTSTEKNAGSEEQTFKLRMNSSYTQPYEGSPT